MEKLKLQAKARDVKESGSRVRGAGSIPAELYGHGLPNLHMAVARGEFEKVFRQAGESTVVELVTEDGKIHNVLVHDIQRNVLTSVVDHIDFYEVSMTEKLTATVELEFTGESKAVRELGGTLVKVLTSVEVESLPADLPHNIPVDISVLQTLQDTITVGQLVVPSGVTILAEPEELVVKVQPPREVEAEITGPVVEDVSKVEGVAEPALSAPGEEKAE